MPCKPQTVFKIIALIILK